MQGRKGRIRVTLSESVALICTCCHKFEALCILMWPHSPVSVQFDLRVSPQWQYQAHPDPVL